MCTSYCNNCNYCVSNCTCTNTTTVPPCTASSGCIDTNYADCIFWRGDNISTCNITITKGDNLEDAILSIKNAICDLTPADLDWASFDYDCLGPFTTAQGFAEGVSSAICALSSGTGVVLPPAVVIPGTAPTNIAALVPGTSSTEDSWTATFADVTAINTFLSTAGVNTTCSAGTWSSVPAGTNLAQWITWIKSNVCTLVSAVKTRATDLETFQSNVESFVGTLDLFDNTDCLGGGGSDTLQDTMALLKTKVCELDTTVSALPDLGALSLSWSTCGGTIGGAWAGYTNSASLTTHLGRIITQLAKRTYNFSGDFTVTPGACGTSVSLATSVTPFSCGDLATCSIHNLGDIDSSTLGTGSGDKFKVLSWDISTEKFYPKTLSFTSSGGTVDVGTKTDNGTALTYNLEVNLTDGGNTDDTGLVTPVDLVIGSASGGSRALTLKYNSNYFSNALTVNFTPAANVTASSYVTDTASFTKKGGVVYMGGAYDWTPVAGLLAGASTALGTVSANGYPTTSNRFIQAIAIDTATDTPSNILIEVDLVGNVSVKNVSGATITAGGAVYAICFSGLSFVA